MTEGAPQRTFADIAQPGRDIVVIVTSVNGGSNGIIVSREFGTEPESQAVQFVTVSAVVPVNGRRQAMMFPAVRFGPGEVGNPDYDQMFVSAPTDELIPSKVVSLLFDRIQGISIGQANPGDVTPNVFVEIYVNNGSPAPAFGSPRSVDDDWYPDSVTVPAATR